MTAADGLHSGSTTFNWDVAPPTLTDRTDVEGATVSLQAPVDYANVSPTFAATGLPSGVSINAATGLISGTIGEGDGIAGPYAVSVTTTYSPQDATTQDFTWTVKPIDNLTPTLDAPAAHTTTAGTQVSIALSAGDSDRDALTYSATGLPDGMSINEFSGVISGTPAEDAIQSAPYVVTATVDDGYGGPNTRLFQEAHVSWSVIADGTVSINKDATTAQWFPSKKVQPDQAIAGVSSPKDGVWIVNNAPPTEGKGLLTDPPVANDVKPTWEWIPS
jgi:Putative Ig domain